MQVNLSKLVSYFNCYEQPLLTLLVWSLRGLRWHCLLLEVTLEDNNFRKRNGTERRNAAVIGQLMEQVISDRSL